MTRSDTLDKELFIEVKYRKKWAIMSLLKETKELAVREDKIPVVVVKQAKEQGFGIFIKDSDFIKVLNVYQSRLLAEAMDNIPKDINNAISLIESARRADNGTKD